MAELSERLNKKWAESGGLGWWMDYCGRLVKTYPSFTREFVLDELPMAEGWCWYAFAYLDDPMHKFSGINAAHGYIFEEAQNLMKQV